MGLGEGGRVGLKFQLPSLELPPLGGQQADFLEEVSHCWSRKAKAHDVWAGVGMRLWVPQLGTAQTKAPQGGVWRDLVRRLGRAMDKGTD